MKPGEEEKKTHYIVSYLDNQIKSAKQLSVDRLQQQELCGGSVETEVVCIELGFAWWKKANNRKIIQRNQGQRQAWLMFPGFLISFSKCLCTNTHKQKNNNKKQNNVFVLLLQAPYLDFPAGRFNMSH